VFHELAQQKESKIMEGHLCSDHVHMCMSIPPTLAVSSVIGYIKGKTAISIARNFTGESFWARGFYISKVGLDEDGVKKYLRDQETEDKRLEQLNQVHNETLHSRGD
jgi:putative transposase